MIGATCIHLSMSATAAEYLCLVLKLVVSCYRPGSGGGIFMPCVGSGGGTPSICCDGSGSGVLAVLVVALARVLLMYGFGR